MPDGAKIDSRVSSAAIALSVFSTSRILVFTIRRVAFSSTRIFVFSRLSGLRRFQSATSDTASFSLSSAAITLPKVGRAPGGERGCQYVGTTGAVGAFKKKQKRERKN